MIPSRLFWHSIMLMSLCLTSSAACAGELKVEHRSASSAATVPAGFRSRTADLGDVKIHYVIGGRGSPVLLIHGWPETWYEWRKVMPILAERHTVIAVDLRGFGESQITSSGYDKKTLAEDLFNLMTRLGYPHSVIVGHDWGSAVGYAYAAVHRDAVGQLVIVEGAPDGPWTLKQKAPFLHNPLWFFGFFEIPGYSEAVIAGHESAFLDWFYRNKDFHAVPEGFSAQDIAYYEDAFGRPGRLAASFQLYRTIDQDIADNTALSQVPLSIPVLAIGAQRGLGDGVAEALRHVAANVKSVSLEGTGHFVADERPEVFARILEDFIGGQDIAPTWKPESGNSAPQ